jgi:4-aminobutyrate aminotransferase/(S)-3-amino-2-methylpropionate transaminase
MMSSNTDLLARLKAVECRDSTYKPKSTPLVFARAKGSMVWDIEGKSYIDLCAGFGALPLGHASEALLAVTREFEKAQPMVEHAMGDVYPSLEKILFLETLRLLMPESYKLGALALSGGQAVEIALKTAMLATKNTGFIAFENAYHGLDLGVLPLTAREDFRRPFKNYLSENHVVRLPYGAPKEEIRAGIAKLKETGLAAIVAEPIQGRAGVNSPPPGWLAMLAEIAHDHSGLLILDEVFTGFGRIGTLSSAEESNADISCFGKAIGGGFPISACFAKENIMNAWPESPGEAIHTGTFFGHPFSAAVGRRTLLAIKEQNLAKRSKNLGEKIKLWLQESLRDSALVKDIRGEGLFIGVEYSTPGYAALLMDKLRSRGVITLPSGATGSVLSITPALNIPEDILFEALGHIVEMSKK